MRSQHHSSSIVLVLLACLALPAMAQRVEDAKPEVEDDYSIKTPDPVEVVAEQMEFLVGELSLDDEQIAKIESVLLTRAVKLNKYIGVFRTDVDQHVKDRKAINKIHRQAETKIIKILTDEQVVRFDELRQEEFAKRGRPPASPETEPAEPAEPGA